MQRRLFEFPLREISKSTHEEVNISTYQQIYYCVNCQLDLNDPDANKFQTRFIRRQIRVVLEPIPGTNLLICPRCGAQHFSRDFNGNKNKHYKNL